MNGAKGFFPFVGLAAAAVLWAAAVGWVLSFANALPGFDAYYHVRLADIMRQGHWVIREFPWTTCSIWADGFFDKDWLFHVFLAPFLTLGDIPGARAAMVATAFLAACVWGLVFRALGCRYLFAATLLTLFCAGYGFFCRLVLCRGHLLSIVFLGLVLLCLFQRRKRLLTAVAFLYGLSYTGAWQAFPVALLFDGVVYWRERGAFRFRDQLSLWVAVGLFAALFAHPNFPVNITGGYVQNILVLKAKWFGVPGGTIVQGAEFQPLPPIRWVTVYLPVLALTAITYITIARRKEFRHLETETLFLAALCAIYGTLTAIALKFTDYFTPIAMAFVVAYWKDARLPFVVTRTRLIAAIALISLIAVPTLARARRDVRRADPKYAESGRWLRENLKPGTIVFVGDWDDSPALFYHAPELRWQVMLEPYFMYLRDPNRYWLWRKIVEGRAMDPLSLIYAEFDAETVFVPKDRPALRAMLERDPRAVLALRGHDGESVFASRFSPKERAALDALKTRPRRVVPAADGR